MSEKQPVPLVIAPADEGLQLNHGIRFGFVGSGYDLPYFTQAIAILTKQFDQPLSLVSMQENDYLAAVLETKNPNLYQESLTKFAKKHKLRYAGQIDYGDPRDLDDGITRGHIVRPQKIHVADQICFTLGGGEQTYSMRQVVISADYLGGLKFKEAVAMIKPQVDFYRQLLARPLKLTRSTDGDLSAAMKQKNAAMLDRVLAALD